MKTKTLSFKKFITYTLAIVCATCAMIAGFFAMGATTASAQVHNDFYMSGNIDIFFEGHDDIQSQAYVYVPDELLSLLNQDAEYTLNNNYTAGTRLDSGDDNYYIDGENVIDNTKKTA